VNGTSGNAPSRTMLMSAAYRAARRNQRPGARVSLHRSYVDFRVARTGASEPEKTIGAENADPAPAAGSGCHAGHSAAGDENRLAPAPGSAFEGVQPALPGKIPDVAGVETAVPPVSGPPSETPLVELGFGPGMLIRLGQLGLRTAGDLAQADAGDLRLALGAISRLVDVDAWIATARRAMDPTSLR
jgi:hypothetical protein